MEPTGAVSPCPGRIIRTHLLARLDQSDAFPLTLLLAPAGSGKSTLLQHWRALRPSRHILVYGIQPRDKAPEHFFRNLLNAIRDLESGFDHAVFTPFSAAIATRAPDIADALREALEALAEPLTLVLDDFQFQDSPFVLEVLERLLTQRPRNVRWILSSRVQPALALSRLRLDDQVLQIDQHDLRVSEQELEQLNLGLGGAPLTVSQQQNLMSMTEGWVAGIKIALLAHSQRGIEALQQFSGSQPEIVDYFGHVVLRGLPDRLRDFFLRTAVFERFNGELCDQVLERSGSALLLERTAAQELFLQPIEQRPGWYRYHNLLHHFLLGRLRLEQPEQMPRLHRRAAHCYLRLNEPEQALLHAQHSQEPGLFMSILEQCTARWLRDGQFAEIQQWLGMLEDSQLLRNPKLAFALICALTLSRRFNQAAYYLDVLQDAELAVASGTKTLGGDLQSDASRLNFLRLSLRFFQLDSDFDLDEDMEHLIASSPHDIRAFALAIAAYYFLLQAHTDRAMRYAVQAKEILAQLGYGFLESYADLLIVLCHRQTGRMVDAVKRVQAFYEGSHRHCPTWTNKATAMVVSLYEQNRLAEAQQLCEELLPHVTAASATEVITTVYLSEARLLHLQGRQNRAKRLLDQLDSILQLGNYERFISQLAQESLRQAVHTGDRDLIHHNARRFGLDRRWAQGHWQRQNRYEERWERYGLACAYWFMATGQMTDAETLLTRLIQILRETSLKARLLVAEANLLVLAQRRDGHRTVVAKLQSLLRQHGLGNFTRTLYDEAPGFAGLVREAQRLQQIDLPELYLETYRDLLIGDAAIDHANAPSGRHTATQCLTAKEQEIFGFLLTGLPNVQIAKHTGITLSTTKWHLKNIYAKLGVANRTEAILQCSR